MSSEESEKISVLTVQIDHLMAHIADLRSRLDKFESAASQGFVTKSEFWPVRTLVYGCVGIVLVSVVTAALALVVRAA